MTPAAVSPGELLLAGIATGMLALAAPEQVPLHPSAAQAGPLSQAADGLADIVAALTAADALSASSRLPGQLAHLCAHLGISGHGITARPARMAQLRDSDDFLLWLRVVPPLDHGTPQTELVATGLSAEVRARLPLTWRDSRPSAGPAARS